MTSTLKTKFEEKYRNTLLSKIQHRLFFTSDYINRLLNTENETNISKKQMRTNAEDFKRIEMRGGTATGI